MHPQELMELPYAGMAEKELRKHGMWRVVATDRERIEWIAENVREARRSSVIQEWRFEIVDDDYDPDFFRGDIDNSAAQHEKETTQ